MHWTQNQVIVQEVGMNKSPIRVHFESAEAGLRTEVYKLVDPNWEFRGDRLRRREHVGVTAGPEPKRRRGRPPKTEEPVTSDAAE